MQFQEINLIEIDEEQLFQVVEQNMKTAHYMEQEIKKLRSLTKNNTKKNTSKISFLPKKSTQALPKEEIDQDFEDEVGYYYDEVLQLTNPNLKKEELEDILPTVDNYQYDRLLLRIKAELLKNIKEIYELFITEKDELTQEDRNEFLQEVNLNKQKIEWINEIQQQNKQEKVLSPIKRKNNLILVPTSSGNIRVIEELKKIDSAYYEGFLGLFTSIIDGGFKNVKRFANNSRLYGMSEVKDFKIRVVFDRIGPHDYAILTAFIKKATNDKIYVEKLDDIITKYRSQKEILKELLGNDEFLEENKKYQTELFHLLSIEKKTDNKTKRK